MTVGEPGSDTAAPTRWQAIAARIDAYERLVRLDKPIGTLLLLWPTLSALWLAAFGSPSWIVVGIFALGTLLMRSAGCAINDYADRNFDAHVERTANRPLLAARTWSTKKFPLCRPAHAPQSTVT